MMEYLAHMGEQTTNQTANHPGWGMFGMMGPGMMAGILVGAGFG